MPRASTWDSALPTFRWSVRVYYEDTDAGGVVYYANFLKFFERCRTEWLRALGIDQVQLAAREGLQFVVRELHCSYRQPARLDDELAVLAQVVRLRGASIDFAQRALRGDQLLAEALVGIACVDARRMRPAALPSALTDRLKDQLR